MSSIKSPTRQQIYKDVLTLLFKGNVGHIGSCLSCIDVLFCLYKSFLKQKDNFILSKGHAAPTLYVLLHYFRSLSSTRLNTFHTPNTTLPVHPPYGMYPDIPFPTGSLGHGLSLTAGIAYGNMLSKNKGKVYCLLSDGECNEGQIWEAAQFAAFHKLNNLIVIIDKNKLQAFGKTKDVLGDSASVKKWKAFGFEVMSCNGHNLAQISSALNKATRSKTSQPKVIIANTIKGFPVSYMKNKLEWHYWPMNEKQYLQAMKEVESKI